jgi:magnesium-transporting ATPase (P-type)
MAATATEHEDALAAGLSASEAERRLAEVGPNTIEEAKGLSPAHRLAANFVQPLALLLWPPLVLGAAELRKAVVRRRRA